MVRGTCHGLSLVGNYFIVYDLSKYRELSLCKESLEPNLYYYRQNYIIVYTYVRAHKSFK